MQIDDAIDAVVAVLQLDKALDGAEIIAEMQVAGRLHAGKHPFLKRHARSPWETSAACHDAACGVPMPRPRLAPQGPAAIVRLPREFIHDSDALRRARHRQCDRRCPCPRRRGFPAPAGHAQGRNGADRGRPRRGDLLGDGPGGRGVRRLGRQHHCRRGEPRSARSLHRQGQGRPAWPGLCPRHPRRRRDFRDDTGRRRRADRTLLCAGDARRRAHHEHLPRRRPGSASRRHRRRHDRGERHHLSRRLFVGPKERQGRVPQGGEDRP